MSGDHPTDQHAHGSFRWTEASRTIHFGPEARRVWQEELAAGYTLLTTPRAGASAHDLTTRAGRVLEVPTGAVAEIAADLRLTASPEVLVALGGGRVIDTAKALAATRAGTVVHAVPTTLSGAEMTRLHRHASGVPDDTPRVRPHVVVNDPVLSGSQTEPGLWASVANALGHALEAPLTRLSNPVSDAVAVEAMRNLHSGVVHEDRDALALGALLAGHALDTASYGVHHVLAQVLAGATDVGHGPANVMLLPFTARHLTSTRPERCAELHRRSGVDVVELADVLLDRWGAGGLRARQLSADDLDRCVDLACARPQLRNIEPAPSREVVAEIYGAAW